MPVILVMLMLSSISTHALADLLGGHGIDTSNNVVLKGNVLKEASQDAPKVVERVDETKPNSEKTKPPIVNQSISSSSVVNKGTTPATVISVLHKAHSESTVVEKGTLLRGLYVFLGISIVVVCYFVFRSYRLCHGGHPTNVVRKYGITARRSDIEMRHLELDDEDDETIFEVGNKSATR